ncbi:WD40 repeat-like protein [Exidia glandulosa HHB12029]|uniref:WD40 repeat-like protein n=1 Tax=Exidia glandulosa HHB12029 TaxID=1314781 RepID=A0A165J5G7_EXIGL|nr:WD40 repeat-like protein [Exidia glandulosa HHB12029]
MSSSIYNHRNLQPTVQNNALQHSTARLNECLETIKQEFDAVLHDSSVLKSQRDDYEGKLQSQVNELNIIRQALYDLEAQHSRIRQQYEDELLKLKNELHQARQQAHANVNPQHPPGLGPSPSNGPPLPPGSLSGPVPPLPPPLQQQQPQQAVGSFDQSPYPRPTAASERSDRDRDRELRGERDRERLGERERDRDRDRDRDLSASQRDAKRIKTEKTAAKPASHSKSQSTSSQGPPPPAPHMYEPQAPPPSQGPPPAPQQQQQQQQPPAAFDADPENIPSDYKKQGSDWLVSFNPRVPRHLDVNLLWTFTHESVVCCVRFSADGRYLATGCNRSAQIYDIKTGQKTHVLVDENASKPGDLYIRSVCFSPDGKYLATGAEDKQIRIWDIAKKRIRTVFEGHGQEIYSLDFSADGKLIVSGSGDKTARIWEMESQRVTVLKIDEPDSPDAGITSVAISPDGRLVAAGSLDTVIRIWDVASGALIERLQGHTDSVYSVAFQPDGKGLVSGSLDKTLKLWDLTPLLRKSDRERTMPLQERRR